MNKKNAVIVVAHNNIEETMPYGITTWQHYCDTHNIDLIIHNEPIEGDFVWDNCCWQKWNVSNAITSQYERILLVDVDTMVRWDAPNIFTTLPDVSIGIIPDQTVYDPEDLEVVGKHHLRQWLEFLPEIRVDTKYYANAGVVLLTPEHYHTISTKMQPFYEYWRETRTLENPPKLDAPEQTAMNIIIWHDIGHVAILSKVWNNMVMASYNDLSFINDSMVWHFTGNQLGGWGAKPSLMETVYRMLASHYAHTPDA